MSRDPVSVTDTVKIKVKKASEVQKEKEDTQTVLVSELDASIRDRQKSQAQSLDELKVKDISREEGTHLLSIPKELRPYEKDFAFYWLGKDKRKIDRGLDVRGWTIVNRVLFPSLPKHLISISGGVERGDCILVCMDKAKAEKLRKDPQERASGLLKATLEKAKTHPDMYEAKISSHEENEANPSGLVDGRDF